MFSVISQILFPIKSAGFFIKKGQTSREIEMTWKTLSSACKVKLSRKHHT